MKQTHRTFICWILEYCTIFMHWICISLSRCDCERSKMCAFSWSKYGRSQSPLGLYQFGYISKILIAFSSFFLGIKDKNWWWNLNWSFQWKFHFTHRRKLIFDAILWHLLVPVTMFHASYFCCAFNNNFISSFNWTQVVHDFLMKFFQP